MISKCYIHLNDYKNSIIDIENALSLYYEFSGNFRSNHSKKYNPKVMLFIETNIFQNILFTYSIICKTFKKAIASNYIILRIFETSPFILSNIHFNAGTDLLNFFEKNKSKLNILDKNFYKNTNLIMEYEKLRKLFAKNISRLYFKNSNKITNNNNSSKNQSIIEINIDKSKFSSNKKSDFVTSRMSSLYFNKNNRNMYKNITLCFSDIIYEKINIEELKYVIIEFLKKYFINDENDKYSFIQFAYNGKKTLFLQPCSLNEFCSKFKKTKIKFENTNLMSKDNEINTSKLFMGLYDLLISIINNYQNNEINDNIIMIFMHSEDIRFSSIEDCINIVDKLNKNNISIYFFCFDKKISGQKINNIQSFLNGLIEGYFFQIKNFKQIEELFVYLSNNRHQSNFFKFDYECFEHIL